MGTEGRGHFLFPYNSASWSPSVTDLSVQRCPQGAVTSRLTDETKLERIVLPANQWQHHICGNMLFKSDLTSGNSLAAQWLGLSAFTAVAWVQSLVRELRSHKPRGVARKKKVT